MNRIRGRTVVEPWQPRLGTVVEKLWWEPLNTSGYHSSIPVPLGRATLGGTVAGEVNP